MPLYVETPLLPSPTLSRHVGRPVLLKLEALQPSGSFKARGMGHICQHHAARGARRFVCASGGNAGLAVAHAGAELGVPVLVVLPHSTPAFMEARLRAAGAQVLVHGDNWNAADAEARRHAAAPGSTYIPPFDDPLIWAGNASLVQEAARQGPRPAAVLLSVGGGGLLCGVIHGLQTVGWSDVPVLAVETAGAASLAAALAADALVTLPAIRTVATSLGARQVAAEALALARRHPVQSLVVQDAEAVAACRRFLDDERLLVEPACGATLAALYQHSAQLPTEAGPLLVVVCGGSVVTAALLTEWCRSLGLGS